MKSWPTRCWCIAFVFAALTIKLVMKSHAFKDAENHQNLWILLNKDKILKKCNLFLQNWNCFIEISSSGFPGFPGIQVKIFISWGSASVTESEIQHVYSECIIQTEFWFDILSLVTQSVESASKWWVHFHPKRSSCSRPLGRQLFFI